MKAVAAGRAVERCAQLAKLGAPPPWWRVFALRRWLRRYRTIMALDISDAAEMLRELYAPSRIAALAARPSPMLALTKSRSRGELVEVVERVRIGTNGEPDESTRSVEVLT